MRIRVLHISSAEFVKSAQRPPQYPAAEHPEIAFAGRSNVGKSSLINALVNRRSLVRTSATPGRTQLLNFFLLNRLYSLVDLPGYGFARVPLSVKRNWGPMVRTYLETRTNLEAVVFILDIRRVPGDEDLRLLDWLEEYGVPTIPVITKLDKVKRSQRSAQLKEIARVTGLSDELFSLVSARSREGLDELRERVFDVLKAPATQHR